MNDPSISSRDAFAVMERALIRRRLQAIEPLLRVEIVALGLLIAGFVFWQTRVPLDGLVRASGAPAFLALVGVAWALLVLVAAWLAGARHLAQLREGPEGPVWLALPVPPAAIARHLAWNARQRVLPLGVIAAGVLAAGVGLVPWWWLAAAGAAFALLLPLSAHAGATVARALATGGRSGKHGALVTLLDVKALAARRATRARPTWQARGGWRAFVAKDLRTAIGLRRLRLRLLVPLAFLAAGAGAWSLPIEPALRGFLALAAALVSAGTFAEWLIALSAADPFAITKTLPLRLADIWRARLAWVAGLAALFLVVQWLAAPASARGLFLLWGGAATLVIGLLGVHYSLTLFPRHDVAIRMLSLSLGLAMAASIMIPLLGWVLLLTGLIHSALRLGRWDRLEDG